MSDTISPSDADGVLTVVQEALASNTRLAIVAGGSKDRFGRPVTADRVVDLSRLDQITQYEPEELVITAAPGVPMARLDATLAEAGQQLAFEPPDYGPLLGRPPGSGTLGGALACNLSGPRRLKDGAARDHLLGVKAVTGRGEAIKAGGRVVKNVTGYDLPKLMAGSFGTLAVFTEVTVRALPRSEDSATAVVFGLDDGAGLDALAAALRTPHEVSGAAHLPAAVADRLAHPALDAAGGGLTCVRVEGFAASVAYRSDELQDLFARRPAAAGKPGVAMVLPESLSEAFWRGIRDVHAFLPAGSDDHRAVWRLSLTADRAVAVVAQIAESLPVEAYYDWGGALVWLRVEARDDDAVGDGGAAVIRAVVGDAGHATLVRASEMVRSAVPVFQPLPRGLAELTRRVKSNFDPAGLLNPGRLYEES